MKAFIPIFLTIAACAGPAGSRIRSGSPPGSVSIRNESGEIVRDAFVRRAGFQSVGSTVYPGTETRHFSPRIPGMGKIEVSWLDGAGERIQKTVAGDEAAGAGGDLDLVIRGDGSVGLRAGETR